MPGGSGSPPQLAPLLQQDPGTPGEGATAASSHDWSPAASSVAHWSPTGRMVRDVVAPPRPLGQHWSPTAGVQEFDTPVQPAATPDGAGLGEGGPGSPDGPHPLRLFAVAGGGAAQERLSWGWLIFQSFFFAASSGTILLVQSVLLPQQVAVAVGAASGSGSGSDSSAGGGGGGGWDENTALGMCSALGAATQLLQPVVGALSDRWRETRRAWMATGQAGCAVACLGLYLSTSVWQLCFWYTCFMLGASVAWGVYMCVVPEYVPAAQHGVASGLIGFANVGGGLAGSGVGFLAGSGVLSMRGVYGGCCAANALAGLAGVLVLLDRPTPAEPGAGGAGSARRTGFFSGFGSAPFAALFFASTVASIGPLFAATFVEYFLGDRVAPCFTVLGKTVSGSAESAAAVYMIVVQLVSTIVVVPAGAAIPRFGGRAIIAASWVLLAASLAPLAATTGFAAVLAFGALLGLSQGLGQGAITAYSAEVLPSAVDAARDMNIVQAGGTLAQVVITYGGGVAISGLQHALGASAAWATLWLAGALAAVLAAPMLYCAVSPCKDVGTAMTPDGERVQ
jgi:MFS family permease